MFTIEKRARGPLAGLLIPDPAIIHIAAGFRDAAAFLMEAVPDLLLIDLETNHAPVELTWTSTFPDPAYRRADGWVEPEAFPDNAHVSFALFGAQRLHNSFDRVILETHLGTVRRRVRRRARASSLMLTESAIYWVPASLKEKPEDIGGGEWLRRNRFWRIPHTALSGHDRMMAEESARDFMDRIARLFPGERRR